VTGAAPEPVAVAAGCAVFWGQGEMHETRAGAMGLLAIVVEGEDLASKVVM
jgi:hypothetical protein